MLVGINSLVGSLLLRDILMFKPPRQKPQMESRLDESAVSHRGNAQGMSSTKIVKLSCTYLASVRETPMGSRNIFLTLERIDIVRIVDSKILL